jgi:erythromycin esterase
MTIRLTLGKYTSTVMEHLLWAMQREGPSGRIALWAHNAHIAKSAVPSTRSDEDVVALWEQGPRLGTHLDAEFRNQYVVIGSTYYEGRGGRVAQQRPAAECGTIAAELGRVDSAAFLLDLRVARTERDANWLTGVRILRADNPTSDWKAIPARAFDAMFFVRNASPVKLAQSK